MGKLSAKLRSVEGGAYGFWCPGCNKMHVVRGWDFNGDVDRPTFRPSVLVTSGHHMPQWSGNGCWCTYNAEHPENPSGFACFRCHSFVTDGQIQFLSDCTHALANQTVPLPDLPDGVD